MAVTAFHPYLKGLRRYAILLLVLYVFGYHLVAILALPIALLTLFLKNRESFQTSIPLRRFLQLGTYAIAGLMAIAVPASFLLPKVISEPGTRTTHAATTKQLNTLINKTPVEIEKATDPFGYQVVRLPLLGYLIQGFSFYHAQTLPFRSLQTNTTTIIWSRGPDGKFDISEELVRNTLESTSGTETLKVFSYDPTNGIITTGDVWVEKQ